MANHCIKKSDREHPSQKAGQKGEKEQKAKGKKKRETEKEGRGERGERAAKEKGTGGAFLSPDN